MCVYERKPGAGSPVAKQPRLDVVSPERPFCSVVLEVDLPDREVIAACHQASMAASWPSERAASSFWSVPGSHLSLVPGWLRQRGPKVTRQCGPKVFLADRKN